ncbi:MAG: tripartite tricarboxylate transporter substrate binding protein [Sheuella sp.]|nr:tripartite tricarboxylate transporter substrate binding protein [Sheuella sp.]
MKHICRPSLSRCTQNFLAAFLIALSGMLNISAASAQEYPNKSITMVVGFPPGGSNDMVARIFAPKMSEILGVPVVVVNKSGSNALIGTEFVVRSPPDGYTITLASASPLAISPHTYAKMPFDTLKDLVGVTTVAQTPELISIHPSVKANNLQELIALSKTRPVTISSSGNGGLPHLAIELLRNAAGDGQIVHVPYKGAGPAIADLLGAHVDGILVDLPPQYPLVQDGRLRAIAVTNTKRAVLLPDTPTSVEQGVPSLLAFNWFSVMAPAKTPKPVIDKLYATLVKAAQDPELIESLRKIGVESFLQPSPEAFAKFLRDETDRWGKVAKASGAKAD